MEINVIGSPKDWPGKPGLMEEENIYFLDLPNVATNPLQFFIFLRKAKKCMILYWVVTEETAKLLPRLPHLILFPLIRLIIKKPGGPAIAIKNLSRDSSFSALADVQVPESESHSAVIKRAYFAAECGHPGIIYHQPMQKERIEWLKVQSRGKILEIGTSTGFVLDYVGGGTGIDIDTLRLEYAKLKYPRSQFVNGDASSMSFTNSEFDTVMIPDILEHVEQVHAKKIVDEASRVGKRLLITVPNAGKKNYDKDLVENPEHKWFPTKAIMQEMVGLKAKITFSPNEDFIYVVLDS